MNGSEKRKHERIDALNLSYIGVDEDNTIVQQGMGRTLNVSESGILLETHFPIDEGSNVVLTLGLEEDLLDFRGKVVRLLTGDEEKFKIGIEFNDIDASGKDILCRYIEVFKSQHQEDI